MSISDQDRLSKHHQIWKQKPVLRRIYGEQFYGRMLAQAAAGTTALEIGSGPGFIREFAPNVLRTDILPSSAINAVVDAHTLPFAENTFDNVFGLDVLHHLSKPLAVLTEISRVLRPGGRLIMVEPWITPFSRFVYTYMHQETCDLSAQPWRKDNDQFAAGKKAFDGNAALPYLLLVRGSEQTASALPALHLTHLESFSTLTYLLSLGFKPGSLLPVFTYPLFYSFEEFTRPVWAKFAALRALIVWTKS